MGTYTNQEELHHYGVVGMKWGHRKAARTVYAGAKRKAYDDYQRDIGAMSKSGQGIKRSELRQRRKQYNAELKTAKKEYKATKKQDRQIEKQASKDYNMRTQLTKDQRKVRAGAVIAATLFTTPIGGAAVAYGTTSYMRAKNNVAQQKRGKATVDDILKSL